MIDISKGRFWDLPWSLVDGCTPCSPGCDHCWSAAMAHRFGSWKDGWNPDRLTDIDGKFTGRIIIHPNRLSIPLKRRKPTVYAVWNDAFHLAVPFTFVDELHKVTSDTIIRHTYLILTKRPERMKLYYQGRAHWENEPNVWKGLTVCNQQEADEKIPVFLQVPGKKFLSIEPMLEAVDFHYNYNSQKRRRRRLWSWNHYRLLQGISAVILGGESGPGARPMHPDWVRSVRDQCAAAGVPFFFKSWGAWKPCDDDHEECEGHKSTAMRLTGELVTDENPCWKDKAFGGPDQGFWKAGSKSGRLLDGRTHDDLPWIEKAADNHGPHNKEREVTCNYS